MNFHISRTSYYADFFLVPLLVLVALACAARGSAFIFAGLAAVVLWTFAEYWIHRVLFHHVFRRAHNLHHKRPKGFDAAPTWLTALLHLALLTGLPLLFGSAVGLGLFIGLEVGYYSYIVVHDKIHHGGKLTGRWLRRARLHGLHHGGAEANFGVTSHLWDHVFRTFQGVDFLKKHG